MKNLKSSYLILIYGGYGKCLCATPYSSGFDALLNAPQIYTDTPKSCHTECCEIRKGFASAAFTYINDQGKECSQTIDIDCQSNKFSFSDPVTDLIRF